ncbi:MAG: RlmE family RNA methyltransferase [Treponema sp.]|nr:RlmE family RNA methyltransferase [Treponema sp.]
MSTGDYKKPDYWSHKAFAEGYPARSVYKLKEIDEKFHLIPKGAAVLDLGAAPGSWTLYVLNKFAGSGQVVACDLQPLAPHIAADNLVFLHGDLNDAAVRERIRSFGPFRAVLCDAAPPTTGNRVVDTARSEQIVDMALWYAEQLLAPGGNCTVKLFQNGSQQAALKKMRTLFTTAKGFKPEACRSGSFETYLVGIDRK